MTFMIIIHDTKYMIKRLQKISWILWFIDKIQKTLSSLFSQVRGEGFEWIFRYSFTSFCLRIFSDIHSYRFVYEHFRIFIHIVLLTNIFGYSFISKAIQKILKSSPFSQAAGESGFERNFDFPLLDCCRRRYFSLRWQRGRHPSSLMWFILFNFFVVAINVWWY